MKRLRRIQLINWHRFTHHTFEVDGHLLLMGDNGSGKSTILDALQVGLVGNMRSVRLNLAANEGGDRSLKSYVLGLVGGSNNGHPGRTLRKNATGYILLEFQDTDNGESLVLGTVIDAHADGRSPDKEHFIAKDAHLEDCPCLSDNNVPRSVREFKRELPKLKHCKRYARVEEYQQAVLRELGGLDPEFFRLFVSGMAFRKIRHLRDFVYDFLLPEAGEVQVVSLREAADRYRQLHELSQEAEQRIALLDRIAANAQSAEASQKEADQLRALIERAKLAAAEADVQSARNKHATLQTELIEATAQHTACEAAHQTARETLARLQQDLAAHEQHNSALAIENRVERLADQIRHENRDSERLQQALQAARTAISHWQKLSREPVLLADTSEPPRSLRDELASAFSPLVANRIEEFDDIAANCLAGEIPPAERRSFVRQVAEDWPALGHWLQSLEFQAANQRKDVEAESKQAQRELQELREGHRPLPAGVIRLQKHLQAGGVSSSVFCELIEIADPQMQDAIEAILGNSRYDLIVPPEQFETAWGIFRKTNDPETAAFGLVETRRLMEASESPLDQSLAKSITSTHPLAKRYADALLSRVVLSGDDSTEGQTADPWLCRITPDGFVSDKFSIRRLPQDREQHAWQMGSAGLTERLEALQQRLKELQARLRELAELHSRIQRTQEWFDRGRRGPEFLAEDYELPARLQELRLQYLAAREEAAALKESDLGQLRRLVEAATESEHQAGKNLKHAWGRQCVAEQSLSNAATALAAAEKTFSEMQAAYQSRWPQGSPLAETCEQIVADKQLSGTWETAISEWSSQLQTLQKSFGQRHDDGVRLRTEYNNRFQFTGDCLAEQIDDYLAERSRWVDSELPHFAEQLDSAKTTARQVLEEEVIHRLRERLHQVERQFRELNQALEGLNFSGRRYRFTYAVRREFQPFHEMIMAAEAVADQPLHNSAWHAQFAEGPLKDLLDDVLGTGGQRALAHLEHCTDYRAYFEYDIDITEADGTRHLFSHVASSGSGGETQTPYYVAMLASLARVYRSHGGQGSRAALVAFDEPFQKMDESNIAATLRLAQRLGLQVLLAAPKDRCHQLLPAMGNATCLLVLRDGNRVLLEPFQKIAEDQFEEDPRPGNRDGRLLVPTTPKRVK